MAPAPLAGLPTPPSYRGLGAVNCSFPVISMMHFGEAGAQSLVWESNVEEHWQTYIEVVGKPLPLVTAEGCPQLLGDLRLRDRGGPGGAGHPGQSLAQADLIFCRKRRP